MQTVVSYVRVRKIFRHHWRVVYTPIYKDLGKASPPDKIRKNQLKDVFNGGNI